MDMCSPCTAAFLAVLLSVLLTPLTFISGLVDAVGPCHRQLQRIQVIAVDMAIIAACSSSVPDLVEADQPSFSGQCAQQPALTFFRRHEMDDG